MSKNLKITKDILKPVIDKPKPRLVIVGAGFGGLYTMREVLKTISSQDLDIVLINKTNYFLFTPMLHEVATGGVGHHQVVESLREFVYKTKVQLVVSEVGWIDLKKKVVSTKFGNINFDYLVIASGATTNFYNVPGALEYSLSLKDLRDAITIRNHIIDCFEKASVIKDPQKRKSLLTFGVVGGGATGVELVTEMAEYFWDTFQKIYTPGIDYHDINLYLFNAQSDVLSVCHPDLRVKTLSVLQEKGVDVHLNSVVSEVRSDGVVVDGGTFIPMNTVIWVAGVMPNTPHFKNEVKLDQGGRVLVNEELEVLGFDNVWAIGDVASCLDIKTNKPLPMLAQVAVQQAKVVAKNIKVKVEGSGISKKFVYKPKGTLISLGKRRAVADIYGVRFYGRLAWYLWRLVYLFKFISWEKRVKIAVDWMMNLFSPRDTTRA